MSLALLALVLTLDEALAQARAHQPQLRFARAGSEAADARAGEARAPLLPQLIGSAGLQERHTGAGFVTQPGLPPSTGSTSTLFSDGLAATQLLWDFGATWSKWRSAQASAQAAALTERATGLQTALLVRSAFFDARANRALVKVASETLANQQRHLEQTEGFVAAGTHPEIDLAQARTDTANARVALITAENGYAVAKAVLNQAMGVEGGIDYEVADEEPKPLQGEDSELDPLLAEALKARPELASLQEQVRAEELVMRSFEGQYWPSIGASAGLAQSGASLDHLGWNASVGVSLTWGIFQGFLTRSQVREAEANVAAAAAQLDALRQQVRLDVENARLSVRAAKATLSASQEALVNARLRLQLAESRFAEGVGSAIELGDAQVALTQASGQLVSADDKLATARAQLLRALGRE